jgi:hypothetical protein
MEMKKFVGMGILILCVLLLISPVAAWAPIISKTCPEQVCSNCPMTCTITVTFLPETYAYIGKVVDTLPAGATDVSSSDGGIYVAGTPGKVTWNPINVPQSTVSLTKTLTVTFTPSVGTFKNTADAWVRRIHPPGVADNWQYHRSAESKLITADVCTSSPEFPSVFLPATMIVGFLGAVLFIQRTREH